MSNVQVKTGRVWESRSQEMNSSYNKINYKDSLWLDLLLQNNRGPNAG